MNLLTDRSSAFVKMFKQKGASRLPKSRKGQMGIMEYILMTFFIMVVIVIIIVFLTGWQVSQLRVEEHTTRQLQTLSALKNVLSSEFLVKDKNVFDDSKLQGMMSLPENEKCPTIEGLFGPDVFFEITVLGEEQVPCTRSIYDPNCNYWSFCKKPQGAFEALVIPVNVYRKFGTVLQDNIIPRTDLGILKVGIYYEE